MNPLSSPVRHVNFASLTLIALCAHTAVSDQVMALQLPEDKNAEVLAARERTYRVVEKQAHHLLTEIHTWDGDPALKLLTDSKSDEHHIRPNTGAVQGFCFLRRFGPYDEKVTGVSRDSLLNETILPMMRYLVATHLTGGRKTGDGKAWGSAWQSAHWAQMLGRGAWWIWADLPDDLREGVRRVIAHEADRIAATKPPFQLKFDTKAEENAWNAQILSIAILLMPDDARRSKWETEFQRWAMSAHLRPSDESNTALVDGRPVKEQFGGANIFDDFTLENHGFIHPDYMSCFSLSLGCTADFKMTGREPPEALLFNVAGLYENIKWMLLPDTGSVYPSGQDWELFRMAGSFGMHVNMSAFGHDPDAWPLALRTLDVIEKMQARPGCKNAIYHPGEWFFPSTQTDIFSMCARAWIDMAYLKAPLAQHPRQRTGVLRLDGGKIMLNRTPSAIHTLSWGAQIMAQCVPMRTDRIVSPDVRSGIGQITLARQSKPLPVKLRDAKIENSTNSFTAHLIVEHGAGEIVSRLSIESRSDGTMRWSEMLTAEKPCATSDIATGLIGILNNPTWVYESGRRAISFDGQASTVTAHSGSVIERNAAKLISIDDMMIIRSPEPLHIRYSAAAKPDRGRATDRLYLNSLAGPRDWEAGQVISKYDVEISCRAARE